MKKTKSKVASIIFIVIMALFIYMPILLLMVYSFTTSKTIGSWNGFSFDLYVEMFNDPEIMTALLNTLIVGVVASLLASLIGVVSSIGIYAMKKNGRRLMDGITQITMVNADIVTAAAFMMFFILVKVIPDGYATLIIAHTVICTPYVIMSVLPKLNQLDPNVYEAGLDLGATPSKTLWKVMVPQLLPAILSGFALAFTISLDDFTISTFVSSSVDTIPQYLYNKLKFKGVMPVLRALSTLILVVAFVILITINLVQNKKKKEKKFF
ncbi:MAG: ABC transporter permease [Clostridia bacterium]|nr:ABC transporter permease [Clostridia bacterium]